MPLRTKIVERDWDISQAWGKKLINDEEKKLLKHCTGDKTLDVIVSWMSQDELEIKKMLIKLYSEKFIELIKPIEEAGLGSLFG